MQEFLCDATDAAYTLDALDNDGTHVTFLQLVSPWLEVVHGKIGHMAVGIDGCDDFGVVGHLYGKGCSAVKGLLQREHTGAAVVERGQLQRVLVGFSARVDEEQLIVLIA